MCLFKIDIFKVMDEKIVRRIVGEIFIKAKKEHASHSKYALSNHISNETNLSARTLERAYDRYINQKIKYGIPQAESIDLLCKYLGYQNFREYVKSNQEAGVIKEPPTKEINNRKLIIIISIVFGMILLSFGVQRWSVYRQANTSVVDKCMTWADSHYIPISCDESPLSKYGTEVKPLDQMELKKMRKVKVTAAYDFFNDAGKPLIWYYKNEAKEYEFFTAPGLHPVSKETLKKITPYIIQTYVHLHTKRSALTDARTYIYKCI